MVVHLTLGPREEVRERGQLVAGPLVTGPQRSQVWCLRHHASLGWEEGEEHNHKWFPGIMRLFLPQQPFTEMPAQETQLRQTRALN